MSKHLTELLGKDEELFGKLLMFCSIRLDEFRNSPWRIGRYVKAGVFVFLYTWKSVFQPFTLFTFIGKQGLFPLVVDDTVFGDYMSFFAILMVRTVKNTPFHRKVNRVKGSGVNFLLYI